MVRGLSVILFNIILIYLYFWGVSYSGVTSHWMFTCLRSTEDLFTLSSSLLLSSPMAPSQYSNRGSALRQAGGLTDDPRHTPVSYATPQWATLHTYELSNTGTRWATPHIMSYAIHNELRHAPMSYATPPISYATPQWATSHPNELMPHTMSYKCPDELRHAPNKLRHTPKIWLSLNRNMPCKIMYAKSSRVLQNYVKMTLVMPWMKWIC